MKEIAHDQLSSYKALNTPATIDFTVGYSILNNSAQSKHETIQYQRAICWYKSNTDNTSNSKNNIELMESERNTHPENYGLYCSFIKQCKYY